MKPKNKYIDAHCHLQNAVDIASVLSVANDCGVVGFICNSAAPNDWDKIMTLCGQYPSIRGCIGVHPWYVNMLAGQTDWRTRMESILSQNPDLMVGEIGLDKFKPDMHAQENIFAAQIDMAYNLHRVVHIHCIGAWDRVFHIFKLRRRDMPPVIIAHAFSGSADIIARLSDEYNTYFSYSPMIANIRRRGVINALRNTPQSRILTESDGANPEIVPSVVDMVASIKSVDMSDMAGIIYNNAYRILK